jgi:hypothetical protein
MSTCLRCQAPCAADAARCPSCGFPQVLHRAEPQRPTATRAPSPSPDWLRPPPRDAAALAPRAPSAPLVAAPDSEPSFLRRTFLAMPAQVDRIDVGGRALVWVLLAYWTISHLSLSVAEGEMNNTFMHRIHLVFHEAGHVIFSPFGDFITVLGGTLGQLIMPALFLGAFVFKYRDAFGGVATLWWLADSLVDVAPYAHDARAQELMLLGGVTGQDVPGYHDWNNMLTTLGWLQHDHLIARGFYLGGAALMIAALAWGLALLIIQARHVRAHRRPF